MPAVFTSRLTICPAVRSGNLARRSAAAAETYAVASEVPEACWYGSVAPADLMCTPGAVSRTPGPELEYRHTLPSCPTAPTPTTPGYVDSLLAFELSLPVPATTTTSFW